MFFKGMFNQIDTALNTVLLSNVAAVMDFMNPIFRSMLIIYVAFWGVQCIMGLNEGFLKESFFRVLKISIVFTCALTTGMYCGVIHDFLFKGPEELSRVFLNTDTSILDDVLTKGLELAGKLWRAGGVTAIGTILLAAVVLVGTASLTGFTVGMIILQKILLAVLVSVGPIFICLILFEATKKFFEAWLSQVLTVFLLYVLLFTCLALLMNIYDVYVTGLLKVHATSTPSLSDVMRIALVSFCSLLVLRQIPSIAAALGGGVALSSLGGFGTAAAAGLGAAKGARAGARGIKNRLPTKANRANKQKALDIKASTAAINAGGKYMAARKTSGGAS